MTREQCEQLAREYDLAADELERIGFIEDSERRRAVARGVALLRREALVHRSAVQDEADS